MGSVGEALAAMKFQKKDVIIVIQALVLASLVVLLYSRRSSRQEVMPFRQTDETATAEDAATEEEEDSGFNFQLPALFTQDERGVSIPAPFKFTIAAPKNA